MKIRFLKGIVICSVLMLAGMNALAQKTEENSVVVIEKEEVLVSNQNQLNDAQLFEKKMLENRKHKKANKKMYTSTRKSGNSSSQKSGVKRKSSKKSSKGGIVSTKMPSLSGGMFVK